jgi:hypothetical protein
LVVVVVGRGEGWVGGGEFVVPSLMDIVAGLRRGEGKARERGEGRGERGGRL